LAIFHELRYCEKCINEFRERFKQLKKQFKEISEFEKIIFEDLFLSEYEFRKTTYCLFCEKPMKWNAPVIGRFLCEKCSCFVPNLRDLIKPEDI